MAKREQPKAVNVQKYLGGISYPRTRDEIVSFAESHNAPREVTETLRSIPDRKYAGPTELSKAIGE